MPFPPEETMEMLLDVGEGAPSLEEKCQLLEMVRRHSGAASRRLDRQLVSCIEQQRKALQEAQHNLEGLMKVHEKLTSPPWYTATFLRQLADQPRALIARNGDRQVVELAEGLSGEDLQPGDEVFLNSEMNMVLARSPWGTRDAGLVGTFLRYGPNGRLVIESRGQQYLLDPASQLEGERLDEGDQIRWDPGTMLAYEKLPSAATQRYFVSEIPDARPEQVGGHHATLQSLLAALTTVLVDPDKARMYQLDGRQTILMVGPPGCGKTLMARVAAAEIARISGKRCRFAVAKPAEWEDPFVGVTQQNIRACFDALKRAAAEDDFVVLFLDEIESVARTRGGITGHHSDKFLAAFLAELDGFEDRGGVAVISASNRKDLIDPAALERLSGIELQVPRPNMQAATEIFQIHLQPTVPFSPNGQQAGPTRQQIIQHAVSRLFDPNAENRLCELQLRDGQRRVICARQLISGRLIAQICRAARQRAFLRDVRTGEGGVRLEDIDEAVSEALQRMATTLSPRNARSYLPELPQDLDVVSVTPMVRPAGYAHRFLRS